jgi:hypothetical protein
MDKEIENTILAGDLVHFVYLDPTGDTTKDYPFDARCHFIPRIGDRLEIGKDKTAFVKSIHHRFLQSDKFEKDIFLQIVTVVLSRRPDLQESAPVQ